MCVLCICANLWRWAVTWLIRVYRVEWVTAERISCLECFRTHTRLVERVVGSLTRRGFLFTITIGDEGCAVLIYTHWQISRTIEPCYVACVNPGEIDVHTNIYACAVFLFLPRNLNITPKFFLLILTFYLQLDLCFDYCYLLYSGSKKVISISKKASTGGRTSCAMLPNKTSTIGYGHRSSNVVLPISYTSRSSSPSATVHCFRAMRSRVKRHSHCCTTSLT